MWSYNYTQRPDELYHHGVLGMKWGVRRYQNKNVSLTNAGRKRRVKSNSSEATHPDYTRAHSKKSVKSMSDSELQKTNNRLNMERQYKSLTSKETSKGKKFVQKAIVGAAATGVTIAVGNRVRKASSVATDKAIDKAIALGRDVIEYGKKYGYSFNHSDLINMWSYNYTQRPDELYHHGVLGMKWGVRRYQNKDGSATAAGKRRYADKSPYEVKTADGDTFHVSKGSSKNYNSKKSKVTKTWGEHLYDVDNQKIQKKADKDFKAIKNQLVKRKMPVKNT